MTELTKIKKPLDNGWYVYEFWLNDQKHGTEEWFDENQKLRKSISYKHGVLDGFWSEWDADGLNIIQDRYNNGTLFYSTKIDRVAKTTHFLYESGSTGITTPDAHRVFFPNGSLKKEIMEKNGLSHGLSRKWNEQGDLIEEEMYDHSKLVYSKKWKNGLLVYEYHKPKRKPLSRFSSNAARIESKFDDVNVDDLPQLWPKLKKKCRIMCSGVEEKQEVTDWRASLFPDVQIGFPDEAWPTLDNFPAIPLFQLRLSDIKDPPRSIRDLGWICIFASARQTPDLSSYIRTYSKDAPVVRLESRAKEVSQLEFARIGDYPYEYPGVLYDYTMENEDLIKLNDCYHGLKVGGWPCWIQEPEPLETEEECIIQLDCSSIRLIDWYDSAFNFERIIITRNLSNGNFKLYHQFS